MNGGDKADLIVVLAGMIVTAAVMAIELWVMLR